jgi:hypothetical protein
MEKSVRQCDGFAGSGYPGVDLTRLRLTEPSCRTYDPALRRLPDYTRPLRA